MNQQNNQPNCLECPMYNKSVFGRGATAANPPKKLVQINKTDILFEEGDNADGVYCMMSGRAMVSKRNNSNKEYGIAIAFAGELLGVSGTINAKKYTTSVQAIDNVKACFIAKNDFLDLLGKYPKLSINTLYLLNRKLNMLEKKL